MKYIIAGVIGFAGVVSPCLSAFKGMTLYIAVNFLFFATVLVVVSWFRRDRAEHMKAIARKQLAHLAGHLCAESIPQVIQIAEERGMRAAVAAVLIEALGSQPDGTKRYWIYAALGRIGGKASELAVKNSLSDENEFARLGAQAAWQAMSRRKRPEWSRIIPISFAVAVLAIVLFSWGSRSGSSPSGGLSLSGDPIPVDRVEKQASPARSGVWQREPVIVSIRWESDGSIVVKIGGVTVGCLEISVERSHPSATRYLELRM